MYISYNASAVLANNSLNRTDNRLQDALARLSSGLKVVNPKDNPSGLAMARRMNAQIKGVSQAGDNASDGISIIEIADGTLNEVSDMLQRMNELAVKASNGVVTDDDRSMIDQEIQQLKSEIQRIGKETTFNGQRILDGSFDLKGYTDDIKTKVAYYSDSVTYGKYDISKLNVSYDADGVIESLSGVPTVTNKDTNVSIPDLKASFSGNTVSIRNDDGWELKVEVHRGNKSSFTADLTGIGSMDMQIGSNEGQQINIRIPKISLENMELANTNVKTEEDANEAMEFVKRAMRYVSSARSNLGSYQNRLEHTVSSLDVTEENMTAAYSRIMDVDMSEEMTEYTTLQVLSQASTSMLAQANDRPSQVLQLLQ